MAVERDELGRRATRNASRADEKVTQPSRPEVGTAGGEGGGWEPVILRSVNAAANSMEFQCADYETTPPVVGQYAAYGDVLTGYPYPGAEAADYESFVWPAETEGDEGEDPVDNPITLATVLLAGRKNRHGDWILMIVLAGNAMPLPDPALINEAGSG